MHHTIKNGNIYYVIISIQYIAQFSSLLCITTLTGFCASFEYCCGHKGHYEETAILVLCGLFNFDTSWSLRYCYSQRLRIPVATSMFCWQMNHGLKDYFYRKLVQDQCGKYKEARQFYHKVIHCYTTQETGPFVIQHHRYRNHGRRPIKHVVMNIGFQNVCKRGLFYSRRRVSLTHH